MINDITFNFIDSNGITKKFIILDKFSKNNKNYIIYKEEKLEEIYASLYKIIDDKIKIIPIDDEKDYDIVDKYLEEL